MIEKYLGILEFNTEENEQGEPIGDWHYFEVVLRQTSEEKRLVFGSACNTGLLESGHLTLEDWESADEGLCELLNDLKAYFRDGKNAVSRIVVYGEL
jgi:hypothetical protein